MPDSRKPRSSPKSRRVERRPEPVAERGPPVDPRERAIVVFLVLAVVSAAWVLGGMRPTGVIAPFGFSVLAFLAAMLPRSFFPDYQPTARLVRFPIFWLGLVFLLWGLIQTLNPASRYVLNLEPRYWYMQRLESIAWLPSGVDTPFARMNGWRMLMIHGAAWVAMCAAWVGLTRRRSGRVLLTALVVNAGLLAAIGIAQRVGGNGKLLWFYGNTGNDFFATFVYRNHAGAFLNLALIIAAALGFWHAGRSERRMLRSSPAVIFGLVAGLIAVAVGMTYSRGALLIAMVSIAAISLLFVVRQLRGQRSRLALGAALALGGLAGYGAFALGAGRTFDRFQEFSNRDLSIASSGRTQAAQATWDMAQVKLWTGWGTGSFRHHFPAFQAKYPEIYGGAWQGRLFWEYAHTDPLQLLAESGIVGCVPLVLGGLYWAYRVARLRFWRSLGSFVS